MSCKLDGTLPQAGIKMCDLPFGKLGVIMESFHCGYLGQIVSRDTNDRFIVLGGPKGSNFRSCCESTVRILEPGELINVQYS